jgi:hypothetical protein
MPGYSGTPLFKKLGIKSGTRILTIGAPSEYAKLITGRPKDSEIVSARARTADLAHIFTHKRSQLAQKLPVLKDRIAPDGMIWVSWPKKSSGVPTDITEDVVREVAFPLDLVDIKVCAVTEIWSGLKLVIRKEARARR